MRAISIKTIRELLQEKNNEAHSNFESLCKNSESQEKLREAKKEINFWNDILDDFEKHQF